MSDTIQEIRTVLEKFQLGYTQRDPVHIAAFMDLFIDSPDLEVIGTGSVTPGKGEWCLGREPVRELVDSDWKFWGDFVLELDKAHIHALGDVAWVAVPATVTMRFPQEEGCQNYLDYLKEMLDKEPARPASEMVRYIVRGASNTLFELGRGEEFVWPIRFTGVLVKQSGQWRFHQMQFAFPTTYYPDVRIVRGEVLI